MLYDRFMFYSHVVDGKLALALQCPLHRIAKARHRLRTLCILVDKINLSANPAL